MAGTVDVRGAKRHGGVLHEGVLVPLGVGQRMAGLQGALRAVRRGRGDDADGHGAGGIAVELLRRGQKELRDERGQLGRSVRHWQVGTLN